jgi:hypothetical protein
MAGSRTGCLCRFAHGWIPSAGVDPRHSSRLVKIELYGKDAENETRCSPATCIGTRSETVMRDPNPKHVSSSFC